MKLMNDYMSAKDAKDKVKKLNSPQVIFEFSEFFDPKLVNKNISLFF